MFFVMNWELTIKGISKKAKDRISNHGHVWTVKDHNNQLQPNSILLCAKDGYLAWFKSNEIEIK